MGHRPDAIKEPIKSKPERRNNMKKSDRSSAALVELPVEVVCHNVARSNLVLVLAAGLLLRGKREVLRNLLALQIDTCTLSLALLQEGRAADGHGLAVPERGGLCLLLLLLALLLDLRSLRFAVLLPLCIGHALVPVGQDLHAKAGRGGSHRRVLGEKIGVEGLEHLVCIGLLLRVLALLVCIGLGIGQLLVKLGSLPCQLLAAGLFCAGQLVNVLSLAQLLQLKKSLLLLFQLLLRARLIALLLQPLALLLALETLPLCLLGILAIEDLQGCHAEILLGVVGAKRCGLLEGIGVIQVKLPTCARMLLSCPELKICLLNRLAVVLLAPCKELHDARLTQGLSVGRSVPLLLLRLPTLLLLDLPRERIQIKPHRALLVIEDTRAALLFSDALRINACLLLGVQRQVHLVHAEG
eukprot:m.13969 g.13969  ORF g.13969 m.13969 type:complete len:412 (+) comp2889_c0_seq2:875-2110(+)